MIIIPELETVVILVPRTGSGALKRAVAAAYPRSMQIYRHMEADGVPLGYDRWRRIGVVRHPLDRLWSLYKFLKKFDPAFKGHGSVYREAQIASVERPFDDWLVNNEVVFTAPYSTAGLGKFYPQFSLRHPLPENRKSQFLYLRPDLGTEVHHYDRIAELHDSLGVTPAHFNATDAIPPPQLRHLSPEAQRHMAAFFEWDFETAGRLIGGGIRGGMAA